jgi:biotin operon repressor
LFPGQRHRRNLRFSLGAFRQTIWKIVERLKAGYW